MNLHGPVKATVGRVWTHDNGTWTMYHYYAVFSGRGEFYSGMTSNTIVRVEHDFYKSHDGAYSSQSIAIRAADGHSPSLSYAGIKRDLHPII